MVYDGVIGVWLEKIQCDFSVYIYDSVSSVYFLINFNIDNCNFLFNVIFNLYLCDDLQMCLLVGKMIQYLGFFSFNLLFMLSLVMVNIIVIGGGGNVYLKFIKFNSYDVMLEWYFNDVGLFIGGVFYYDIIGYIENYMFE